MKNSTFISTISKPYSNSFITLSMLVFMLFLGTSNNVLHATNETGLQKSAQLYTSENTTITIYNNTIITENFKSLNLEFSTSNSQTLHNTLYITSGTTYFIDRANNNYLQVIEINPLQNNVAKNTTKQKSTTTHSKTHISKPKPNSNPFSTLPFRSPNDYYFTSSLISAKLTTQNPIKANLQTLGLNSLLFPTAQLNATYYNNAINATSQFCRYSFSLPPPSAHTSPTCWWKEGKV